GDGRRARSPDRHDVADQGRLGDAGDPVYILGRRLPQADRRGGRLRLRTSGRSWSLSLGLGAEEPPERLERVGQLATLDLGELVREAFERPNEAAIAHLVL